MKNKEKGIAQYAALFAVVAVAVGALLLSSSLSRFNGSVKSEASSADTTVEFNVGSMANQDGSSVTAAGSQAWIGTGQSTTSSYLGLYFTGANIPSNVTVTSASVSFTAVGGWINMGVTFAGGTNNGGAFSNTNKISNVSLTNTKKSYSDDVKWEANTTYSYDVTDVIKELVGSNGASSVLLIAKGTGGAYGRKFIYASGGKSPKLSVTYSVISTSSTPVATATATSTASSRPSSSPIATATATASSRPSTSPVSSPTPTTVATGTPNATPVVTPVSGNAGIYGAVSADLLGTCTSAVHDRYVVRGPDGMVYRTWHPQTVPVDANNPGGAKCTFAHEHGVDPATSNIFAGPVAFDYIAKQIGMDEPHAGFKCFVQNKGTQNDEGGVALHDAYYCFHMGTGGAARFTTQFHSLDFHLRTANGARMDIQGLADTKGASSICETRNGKVFLTLGCKVDSAYEIWENSLRISNKGNTVAGTVVSTAVFDPITVRDPSDATKLIYVTDPLAASSVFKFNDSRADYRGCDRESYTGPLSWNNAGGAATYYTDAYGEVAAGGTLKQTITPSSLRQVGTVDSFGALIMAYKGGNLSDPQSQFKYHKETCGSGLGLKN